MNPLRTAFASLIAVTAFAAAHASVVVQPFGHLEGATVINQYVLTNRNGLVCKVITYGATITDVIAPDRDGHPASIILGFDSLDGYLAKPPFFGATIGRVGNRIAKGQFTLDGKSYSLATTDGPNSLHGGLRGFDKRVWAGRITGPDTVEMSRISPDGEEGYPGNLTVTVAFTLNDANQLVIDYHATTDAATPINLTNHTYWNLAGHGTILDQVLQMDASHYTPVDSTLIPTGEIAAVAGGPMDFRSAKPVGRDLGQLADKPQGFDHNWVLDHPGDGIFPAAVVTDPSSGRVMTVYTDQPGIQFYSGNFLDGSIVGRGGWKYEIHDALCLETQHFPDSVNHDNFPPTILRPGEVYRTRTIYAFKAQ
ncbi:MAG TPA: aldose epimerase family protein [Opitutaceae bacterium]